MFVVGYVLGRLGLLQKGLQKDAEYLGKPKQTRGWMTKGSESNKPIRMVDIDESKFVTDVSTDSFKSKHKKIGKQTVAEDDISSSVSKLKRLKGD